MFAVSRLAAVAGAAAVAFSLGIGPAAADDDRRGWKHYKRHHHHHRHQHYDPRPDVVVIERHYHRPRPPRVIYVEPAPVYQRPEINIVFPLRF